MSNRRARRSRVAFLAVLLLLAPLLATVGTARAQDPVTPAASPEAEGGVR